MSFVKFLHKFAKWDMALQLSIIILLIIGGVIYSYIVSP